MKYIFTLVFLFFSTFVYAGEWNDIVRESKFGILSTDYFGTPYGSLMPYILDNKGRPIIYVSDLAIHTDNLEKSSKCSLTVFKIDKENLFNSARITFIGKMVKAKNKKSLKGIRKLYLEKYPKASDFGKFSDFYFYRMEISDIYVIGGFGDINWWNVDEYHKSWGMK